MVELISHMGFVQCCAVLSAMIEASGIHSRRPGPNILADARRGRSVMERRKEPLIGTWSGKANKGMQCLGVN
eukprot:4402398-Pyramimonas_sp.AAC.1